MTKNIIAALLLSIIIIPSASAQTTSATPNSSTQAITLASQSTTALTRGLPVTDAILNGTAKWGSRPDAPTGSVTIRIRPGKSRIDVALPGGTRSEMFDATSDPVGIWSGPDGHVHAQAMHNCWVEANLFPALSYLSSGTGITFTYVGQEVLNGVTVHHIQGWKQLAAGGSRWKALVRRLSQTDFYLNAGSFLPVRVRFNLHPDDDELRDIPVEIRFSDYRQIDGVAVPFRIQKFFNGTPLLDVTVQSASLNSGIPDSVFSFQ